MAGPLLGLVPALQSTRPDVAGALRRENAGGGHLGQLRWRNALVVTQLAISLVLLVGAGRFLRSFGGSSWSTRAFGPRPTAVVLSDTDVVQPDLLFVPRERSTRSPPRTCGEPPTS